MTDAAEYDDAELELFYAEVVYAFGMLSDWSRLQPSQPIETVQTAQALAYCAMLAVHRLAYVCDLTVPEVIARLVEELPVDAKDFPK